MNYGIGIRTMKYVELVKKYHEYKCSGRCSECSCWDLCSMIDYQMCACRSALELFFEKVGEFNHD